MHGFSHSQFSMVSSTMYAIHCMAHEKSSAWNERSKRKEQCDKSNEMRKRWQFLRHLTWKIAFLFRLFSHRRCDWCEQFAYSVTLYVSSIFGIFVTEKWIQRQMAEHQRQREQSVVRPSLSIIFSSWLILVKALYV